MPSENINILNLTMFYDAYSCNIIKMFESWLEFRKNHTVDTGGRTTDPDEVGLNWNTLFEFLWSELNRFDCGNPDIFDEEITATSTVGLYLAANPKGSDVNPAKTGNRNTHVVINRKR